MARDLILVDKVSNSLDIGIFPEFNTKFDRGPSTRRPVSERLPDIEDTESPDLQKTVDHFRSSSDQYAIRQLHIDDIVGDELMSSGNQIESRLGLAYSRFADQQNAYLKDPDQSAVKLKALSLAAVR